VISDTSIIKTLAVSNPANSKILLNTIIAALLGLFAGAFLVLAADWWQKPRE